MRYEVEDADIVWSEPAAEMRPLVRKRYASLARFFEQYLAMRRGEPVVITPPPGVGPGALIDLEIAVGGLDPVVLHAQLMDRPPAARSELARAEVVTGAFTDRIVGALVRRSTAKLLG